MLKKLFGGRAAASPGREEHSIDDLIVLERYHEAIERLEARLKSNPRDLHSHLKLAEVFSQARHGHQGARPVPVRRRLLHRGRLLRQVARPAHQGLQAGARTTSRWSAASCATSASRSSSTAGCWPSRGWSTRQSAQSPLEKTSPVEVAARLAGARGLEAGRAAHRRAAEAAASSGAAITEWSPGEVVAERGSSIERLFIVAGGSLEAVDRRTPRTARRSRCGLSPPATSSASGRCSSTSPGRRPIAWSRRAKLLRIDRAGLEKSMSGLADPRGLLEAMRAQHADRDVAAAVEKLLASSA